jgi:hypothetical protein
MIFKEVFCENDDGKADHEEIPEEELWEDGECRIDDVREKILYHTLQEGDWMIIRRIDG